MKNNSVLVIYLRLLIKVSIFFLSICSNSHATTNANEGNDASLRFISPGFDKDLGVFGEWKANAVLSGFGMLQSNPDQTNKAQLVDLSNALILVEQKKGSFGIFAQIGYYDILDIGQPDQRINKQTINSFGVLPQAQINYSIDKNLKISIGKLPA